VAVGAEVSLVIGHLALPGCVVPQLARGARYLRQTVGWEMVRREPFLSNGVVPRNTGSVAPPAGFEPATFRLEGGCSVR
jgi:hypothetical protein